MANTLSLLVRQQLPEYIRSEYDTFAAFIEAYYEWMDRSNNAIEVAKSFPSNIDLDTSVNGFIEYFTKQFLPLFPADRLTRPEFLIQHAKEFYRSKGTAKSVQLLFRILFNQDVELFYPKESILKCSDGEWVRRTSLRLDQTLWTIQTGDGTTTVFHALTSSTVAGAVVVYLDGVLQSSGYTHSPNRDEIRFTTAPGANVEIKVEYAADNITSLFNSGALVVRVYGTTSGASATSETAQLVAEDAVEQFDLQVSSPTGTFSQSETIYADWTYDITTGDSIRLYGQLVSYLGSITILDGGSSYNVSDPVLISGGSPTVNATAVVDEVLTAVITNISVINGGAGYQAGLPGYIISTPNTGLTVFVSSVDTTGTIHPNSYPINTDVISLWGNTVISQANYYFRSAITENVNTIMSQAFTDYILGESGPERLGPIANISITTSTQVFSAAPTIVFDSPTVIVTGNTANSNTATANVTLSYFGILGRMNVVSGGTGYTVGDEISFENVPGVGKGIGGAAEVTEVHSANSGIKSVRFQPTRVTGNVSVNVTANTVQVVGTNTFFTTELLVGDRVELNTESSYVTSIANNTHLWVNTAFTRTSTNRRLGVYGRYFIGGINYDMNARPTVHISSANANATSANITVDAVISGGTNFNPTSNNDSPGRILSIRVTNPGYGYTSYPIIDLSGSGDGRANAIAVMLSNLFTSEGSYASTRGFLSSDRRIQGNDFFYENYSYVVRSQTELSKYKSVLKNLIHPAGFQLWGEYTIESSIQSPGGATANIANTYQGVA
jgi:hypothetical protein